MFVKCLCDFVMNLVSNLGLLNFIMDFFGMVCGLISFVWICGES